MRAVFAIVALVGLCLAAPERAAACPICIPSQGGGPPALEQMAGAGALVLAEVHDAPRRLKIAAVLKGKVAQGASIEIAYADMPRARFERGKLVIVARHPLLNSWQPLGEIPQEREKWLRATLALRPSGDLSGDEWPARVRYFADDLFASDAFVSGVAASQVARAPYAAMRALRGSLHGSSLVAAANRIENIPHLPLLILLMGVAGDEPSRAFIAQRARAAGSLANANELAALLTAQIELEGADALRMRGKEMLVRASARPSDLSAAVMALGVFAGAFGDARRAEVVALYRDALPARPELAGPVARTMEDWRDWSMAGMIADASKSSKVDQGSQLLIRSYLEAAAGATSRATN